MNKLLRTIGKINTQSTLHEVQYNPEKGHNTTEIQNNATIQYNSTTNEITDESSHDVEDVIRMRSTINNQRYVVSHFVKSNTLLCSFKPPKSKASTHMHSLSKS